VPYLIDGIKYDKKEFDKFLQVDNEIDAEIEYDRLIGEKTELIVIMGYFLDPAEVFKKMSPKAYDRELKIYTQTKLELVQKTLETEKYIVVNGNEYEITEEPNGNIQENGIN
jgi:hypothetical protein